MQTEGRENCGGFSPFLWKNRARGAERGLRSGKGRSAAHSPLYAAKTSRITLSCILRSKIVHFWRFPACECVCGDMRRIPFLLRILRATEGAAGFLRAFFPFGSPCPQTAYRGCDMLSFPHSALHCRSLLSALEIPSAHVYNVFMKSHQEDIL